MRSPSTDPPMADPLSADAPPTFRTGMPPAVVAGVIIEALLSAQSLFAGHIAWAAIGVALCVGLHHRVVIAQRLVLVAALLWSLLIGALVLMMAFAVLSIDEGPKVGILSVGLLPGVLYVGVRIAQIVALTRPEARVFFGLDCPECGSHAFRAQSATYSRVQCRMCGHAWQTGRRG